MSLPLLFDSDDGDSLPLSELTIQEHPEEIRSAFDTDVLEYNPDNIDIDLYLEMTEPEEEEQKPIKPEKKPSTLQDVEDQLVFVCLGNGSIFQTLYLLHEHFSKSSDQNQKQRLDTKNRILGKVSGSVSKEREFEIRTVLNNFFK